jgi:single-strand DNA-binding protein
MTGPVPRPIKTNRTLTLRRAPVEGAHLIPEWARPGAPGDIGVGMSIPTQMSLVGFIVSAPELHFTAAGKEHIRVRVGVEQSRHEADGTFTKLDPTFHDMVAFESTARETYAHFRPGDCFVASGYVHEYEVGNQGGSVIKEEFVARKIGHNANRTRYVVQRGRHAAPEPALASVPHPSAVGL